MHDHYHKIITVFTRDPATKHRTLIWGDFATPEFSALADLQWVWTEKVDGTNIRVCWSPADQSVKFGGKTDNAQIHAPLVWKLQEMFTPDLFKEQGFEDEITLYGEGYGARIQKGGGKYITDSCSFVLFDARVGDWWLTRDSIDDIGQRLNIRVVPEIGRGTLVEAANLCREGFPSQWGDFRAEGIVARPPIDLFNRRGVRIITKVKCKDFG